MRWESPGLRAWVGLRRRELRLERAREHALQRVILEAVDPLLLVEHAEAAANDLFGRRTVREADARLPVVLVDRVRLGVWEIRIPELQERRYVNVITQAEVQREVLRELPLVLHEGASRMRSGEQLHHLRHANREPFRIRRRIGCVEVAVRPELERAVHEALIFPVVLAQLIL